MKKFRLGVRAAMLLGGVACMLAVAAPMAEEWLDGYWAPGSGRVMGAMVLGRNSHGAVATLQPGGATDTKDHPFFTPIGRNGRACVTCHQPSDGMSISVDTIRARWQATSGRDPLFAMIDGANCPNLPAGNADSHSLLLRRGLFRISRPWPPQAADGSAVTPEFTIEVVRDPTSCNTDKVWGLNSQRPYISVFRRPRPATNLKYTTAIGYDFEPKNGLPVPLDPETGRPTSGNLMADGRALTLRAQALDAMRWHLEVGAMPEAQKTQLVQRIIDFETGLYTAQLIDQRAGRLDADGAKGGPALLATEIVNGSEVYQPLIGIYR